MPRDYRKTSTAPREAPRSPETLIHVVWTDKTGYTRTFTDRLAAERYAATQRKYSSMVQFKTHKSLSAASNWIAKENHRMNTIRQQIHNITPTAVDVTEKMKSPLELLLEEQERLHPPLLRTCIFFTDGSKKPNRDATVGMVCKQLGIAETIKLPSGHNHQSAELSGIVFALETFLVELEKTSESGNQFNRLVCVSDSDYAVKTVKTWVHEWIGKFEENGTWYTTRKEPVKFVDIIKRNLDLERKITAKGVKVEYLWVKREFNKVADLLSNGKLPPREEYNEFPKDCTLEEWENRCKAAQVTGEAQ